MKKSSLGEFLLEIMEYLYGSAYGIIFFLVILGAGVISFPFKQVFQYTNLTYLMAGILLWGVILFLENKFLSRWREILKKYSGKGIVICTIIFFIALVFGVYNYYFITGWDVGILLRAAKAVVDGTEISEYTPHYLSMYPNNKFLLSIFIGIMKIMDCFGSESMENSVMGILVFQCLLSAGTSFLLFKIAETMTGSLKFAWNIWLMYIMTIGVSPWVSIPYTDAMGISVPVIILFLFVSLKNQKYVYLKYFAIAGLSVIGYKLKPQLFIITIAIVIVSLCNISIKKIATNHKKYLKRCIAVLLGIIISVGGVQMAISSIPIETNKEEEFGMAHFLMMGLNSSNHGGYLEADINFTKEQEVSERTAADLKVALERIENYGFVGFFKHLVKKTLNNYADGVWFWGREGGFFSTVLENKNETISSLLKSLYYNEGDNYNYFLNHSQTMWMMILFGCFVCFFFRKKYKNRTTVEVMMLAVVGVMIFQLLFESRSRYLYCYVPIYILLAGLGLQRLTEYLRQVCYRITDKNCVKN